MLIWDFLAALLVVFPLLTGGLLLQGPGYHLEYTQPGIAAAILCAWLWWSSRANSALWHRSFFCVRAHALWQRWCHSLLARPWKTLFVAWGVAGALWFVTSLARHRALRSGLADLGIFTNGIWNFSRLGFPFSSLKEGASLFADHQIFLLYPLAWIFPLWPSPAFLLLIQAAGLSAGGIALYLLGKQRLGEGHPVLPWLPIAYWMCGPLRSANLFDFHPEVLMLPLFLFSAFLLQEKSWARRALGFACFLAALCAKESAGPVACGIGLAWLLGAGPASTRNFTRGISGVIIALGLGMFYFDSSVMPKLLGVKYAYGDLYAPFGASALEILLAPFQHSGIFFGRVLSLSRLKFFLGALLPLAFLPLLAPAALVAAVPGFLMLFLTNGDQRISLGFHYAIEPMVGLLFALPAALDSKWMKRKLPWVLGLFMLATLLSYGRSEPYFWRIFRATPHQVWLRDVLLPAIPQERSVTASYGLVPHISTRRWVNQLPFFLDHEKASVDCALIDPEVNNTPLSSAELAAARSALAAQGFIRELECGSLALYRREGGPQCLGSRISCGEAP